MGERGYRFANTAATDVCISNGCNRVVMGGQAGTGVARGSKSHTESYSWFSAPIPPRRLDHKVATGGLSASR